MSDLGVFNEEAAKRILFFRKSEKILEYIHEIQRELDWSEKKILDKAADIITDLMNRKMNSQNKTSNELEKESK